MIVSGQELAKFFRIGAFFGEGGFYISPALAEESQFGVESGELFAQVAFLDGRLVRLQSKFCIQDGGFSEFEMSRQLVAVIFGAVEIEVGFVEFEARVFQFSTVKFAACTAGNVAVRDSAAAVGGAFFVELINLVEGLDAFTHIGGEAFEVAQGIELLLQVFYVE